MTQRTAVIYARVSDRRQAAEDVSVPTQIEHAQKRAADLGATVLRVFSDLGRTAFKEGSRPAFVEAIEFAGMVGASYFITWSTSRFARNRFEAAIYKRALDKAGVALIYLATDIDRSTDEGWLTDSLLELIDEMNSRSNSKDTRRSMLRNAQLGYFCGGRPPYGFRSVPDPVDPKRRRLEALPDEAEIVRRMFALRARGLGAYQIADLFNTEGVRYRSDDRWSKKNVLAVLRSESVIGMSVFNRTDSRRKVPRPREDWIVIESHAPIVDRPLFDLVQKAMDAATEVSQKGSPRSQHAFTGLARCGACGGVMVIETGKGRHGKVYSYYRCRRVRQAEDCSAGRRLSAAKFDAWMSEVILARVLTPSNLAEIAAGIAEEASRWGEQRRQRTSHAGTKIAELRARNARLYDLLELHGRDAPNLGDLTERLRANNAEIKALEAEQAVLSAAPADSIAAEIDVVELAEFMRAMLTDPANASRARNFYTSFIDRIDVTDTEATIHYDPARLILVAENKNPAGQRPRRGSQWKEVASPRGFEPRSLP
jgi:site-specific DNA recombinase